MKPWNTRSTGESVPKTLPDPRPSAERTPLTESTERTGPGGARGAGPVEPPRTDRPSAPGWRRRLILLLKAVLSVLLIAFLVQNVDWPAMRQHMTVAKPFWIGVAFAIWLGQYLVNALKWQAAMAVHGLRYPLGFLVRVYFISSFFTNFFPSSVGGDGYRLLRTLPDEGRSRAISAILLERIVGVLSLLALGFVAALYIGSTRGHQIAWTYVGLGVVGMGIAALGLAMVRTSPIRRLTLRLRTNSKIDGLAQNLDWIRANPAGVVRVFVFSVMFQSFAILAIWIIARFGLSAPFTVPDTALATALAELAAALPFSLNGLGLMEGTFSWVGTRLGIPFDSGLLVAVTLRLLLVPLGIICGVVYMLELASGRNGERPVRA